MDIVTTSDEDGIATVTLDGSGSYDPNGDALTYSWTLDGTVVSTDVSFDYDLNVGVFTLHLPSAMVYQQRVTMLL
jgi:hypothetical protein